MSTAPPDLPPDAPSLRHSPFEDLLGLATGTVIVSLGLAMLSDAGVVTGGTAGLALLLSYAIAVPFGVLFGAVNLPFLVLGIWRKGWVFTLRTVGCVVAVSVLTPLHRLALDGLDAPAGYAAIVGNVLAGVGLLIIFRHRASLGGFNIIALIAQEQFGWRAGWVQLALDGAVVAASLLVVDPLLVAISAAGALVLNLIIAMNHRPGRYTGY